MSWGSVRNISHDGLLFPGGISFIQSGMTKATDEGAPVKVSAAKTVSLCSDGDVIHGFVLAVEEDDRCSVQINSFVTTTYSGNDFVVGRRDILADGSGGVKCGSTNAQGTISLTDLPAANGTITIGTQQFVFKAARASSLQITIGASVDACVANIASAINSDSTYASAVASTAADTVVVTALVPGTGGNSVVFTEAATNLTIDGSGTLGTTTAGANGTGPTYLVTDVDTDNSTVTFVFKQ